MNTAVEITPQWLASAAVEAFVRDKQVFAPPQELPDYLAIKAGAFVSIKTGRGELRGCIGTIEPVRENIAEEIVRNAIKAASEDYRFIPVRSEELIHLNYSVDILSPIEPIEDLNDHDVKVHGLIIESMAGRRGVLLPDLAGIESAEAQLTALRNKIGLLSDIPVKMSRFRVQRYGKK
jgi:AmmeMemoRadiSam system protein A